MGLEQWQGRSPVRVGCSLGLSHGGGRPGGTVEEKFLR